MKQTTIRSYPLGRTASHVLGYVGAITQEELDVHATSPKTYSLGDEVGKTGVEKTYEDYLRGTPGRQTLEVDAKGNTVRELVERPASPRRRPVPDDRRQRAGDHRAVAARRARQRAQPSQQGRQLQRGTRRRFRHRRPEQRPGHRDGVVPGLRPGRVHQAASRATGGRSSTTRATSSRSTTARCKASTRRARRSSS